MSLIYTFNRKYGTHLSLWIIVFSIAFLPLFKGGNYPGVMSVFLLAMAIVFLFSFASEENKKPEIWFFVWGVVSISVVMHVFIYPFFLTSERFFMGGLTSDVFRLLGKESLSKIRVLEVWSYFSVMWIFTWRVSIAPRKQVVVLLTTLFFVSSFQAFFGVAHFISGAESVLGLWTKEHYLGDATGTFVNRNHFSGMLAIASPIVLSGFLVSKPLIFPTLSRSGHFFIAVIYSILILFALISSHSRMGLVAGMFGGFVFLFTLLKPEGSKAVSSIYSRSKLILIVFFTMLLFATWFGFADILNRYIQLGDGNSRLDVWKAMFSMSWDVWFFGIGPGQFEDVFQIIKPSHFSVRFVYAHNDYLEFIFEFGLLSSVVIFSACIFWFKSLKQNFNNHLLKPGILGAFFAVALHSLVDFNLQVPASAMCFCLAVGMWANPDIKRDEKPQRKMNGSRSRKKLSRPKSRWPQNKREWLDFLRSK